ncbi:MAG: aldose 1-epimerase family protein [Pedobacter sp.]|nr:MAG: aldose 1-epimerase family protein [Pedobacter sp.]
MIHLENEQFTATFNAHGAELQSLVNKNTGLDYIWSADPKFWAKHSPILFPIVGALKDNSYTYSGQRFELPRHGFARDREFGVEKISETVLLFSLKADAESMAVFPFDFVLALRYTLTDTGLRCSYEVSNPGTENLLFSIGGHPAFATPVTGGISYTDYELVFNADSDLTYYEITDNLISNHTQTIALSENTLRLSHELFYNDALVFKTLKSDQITLRNTVNEHGMEFHFEGFPYFGIWSAKDADFVCLEPWCGIADGVEHDQELAHKEGIVTLAPQAAWSRSWEVKLF